jgi:hypothetical protein
MTKVDRHRFDRARIENRRQRDKTFVPGLIQGLRENANAAGLGMLFVNALRWAQCEAAIEPDSPDLKRAFLSAAQSCAALFALAAAKEGTRVKVKLGEGPPVPMAAQGPSSESHSAKWTTGFYCAMIVRDKPSRRLLSDTPIEVFEGSSSKGDAWGDLWAETLKLVGQGARDASVLKLLNKALAATDPKKLRVSGTVDLVLRVRVQEMKLLFRILQKDEAAFEQALVEALEEHQKYWTKVMKEPSDPDGLLAIGPTAMACLARDRHKWKVDVESPYLPRL